MLFSSTCRPHPHQRVLCSDVRPPHTSAHAPCIHAPLTNHVSFPLDSSNPFMARTRMASHQRRRWRPSRNVPAARVVTWQHEPPVGSKRRRLCAPGFVQLRFQVGCREQASSRRRTAAALSSCLFALAVARTHPLYDERRRRRKLPQVF